MEEFSIGDEVQVEVGSNTYYGVVYCSDYCVFEVESGSRITESHARSYHELVPYVGKYYDTRMIPSKYVSHTGLLLGGE